MKKLIVNADDFGVTQSVNEGIIYGFKNGIITSTSLMVNRPYAKEAAELAKKNSKLGIGLHFTLYDDNQIIRGEEKLLAYFAGGLKQKEKAKKQFYEQIDRFKQLTGKMPDHIDGHHHAHKVPPFLPFIKKFSEENKIPYRMMENIYFIESFSDYYHPENASVNNLVAILKKLPEGISELITHTGYSSYELKKISSMSDCRELELKTLTSPEIKKVIQEEKIELIRWSQI